MFIRPRQNTISRLNHITILTSNSVHIKYLERADGMSITNPNKLEEYLNGIYFVELVRLLIISDTYEASMLSSSLKAIHSPHP